MRQNFLTSSRHGSVFYFRRRVPDDLRGIIGQSYLVKTLATTNKVKATILARAYAARTDAIYYRLREMKTSAPDSLVFDYTLELSFDDGGNTKVKIDATPDETEAVASVMAAVLQNLPQTLTVNSTPSIARIQLSPGDLLDDFFREGVGAARWKDPARTKSHDYDPIWAKFSPFLEQHGISLEAARHYRAAVLNSSVSPETKHRNLYRMHAVVLFGVERHELDVKMLKELKMPTVKGRGKNKRAKPYTPFTQTDLESLFHSEAYKNHSFKKPPDQRSSRF